MTFFSALILGLLASAHCAGMCGGLQMALQAGGPHEVAIRSKRKSTHHLLLLNLGRINTYIVLGVVLSTVGITILSGFNIASVSLVLRFLSGLILIVIGLFLILGRHNPFNYFERFGHKLWSFVSRTINHSRSDAASSYATGLAWGFLPCGLIYSVLLSTAFTQGAASAALTMLGFGLGTLPALLLTGFSYLRFRKLIESRWTQTAGGLFFMLGGLLVISAPYWVDTAFLQDYPQLLNLAFCIS